MTRVATTNYNGEVTTLFEWATAGSDRFNRERDLYFLAQALEKHTHASGKGLAVQRLANGIVEAAHLAANAITTPAVLDDAITQAKLADDSVGAAQIQDNAIEVQHIGTGVINATHLTTNSVGADEIVAQGVGTSEIADRAVTELKIAISAITGDSGTSAIGADSIHGNRLKTGTIDITEVLRAFTVKSIDFARLHSTNDPTPGQYPAYNSGSGTLTWTSLPSAVNPVPAGAVVWFQLTSELTAAGAGWALFTAASGLLLISAGTTFGQSFAENNSYGTWNVAAVTLSGTASVSGTGGTGTAAAGTTGTPSSANGIGNNGGVSAPVPDHTHSQSSVAVTGVSLSSSGSITGTAVAHTVIPAVRCGVYGRKL